MRDKNRISEMLKDIEKIWNKYPDLRLGQLIMNLDGNIDENIYYLEDKDLIDKLDYFYKEEFRG